VEAKMQSYGKWSEIRKRKFSVYPIEQKKKYCGGIRVES